MAVVATDLELPTGYLPVAWYETATLDAWIDEGETKAASITDADTQDEAVRAWAYYRAYDAKAQEKEDQPQSKSISGQVSVTYGDRRAETWRLKATEWLAVFNDYLAGEQADTPSFLFARAPGRRGI